MPAGTPAGLRSLPRATAEVHVPLVASDSPEASEVTIRPLTSLSSSTRQTSYVVRTTSSSAFAVLRSCLRRARYAAAARSISHLVVPRSRRMMRFVRGNQVKRARHAALLQNTSTRPEPKWTSPVSKATAMQGIANTDVHPHSGQARMLLSIHSLSSLCGSGGRYSVTPGPCHRLLAAGVRLTPHPATEPPLLFSLIMSPVPGPGAPFRLSSRQAGSVSSLRVNSSSPSRE